MRKCSDIDALLSTIPINNAYTNAYTLPEGFSADAMVLRIFRAKSSWLKPSFRSSVSAIGVIDPPDSEF